MMRCRVSLSPFGSFGSSSSLLKVESDLPDSAKGDPSLSSPSPASDPSPLLGALSWLKLSLSLGPVLIGGLKLAARRWNQGMKYWPAVSFGLKDLTVKNLSPYGKEIRKKIQGPYSTRNLRTFSLRIEKSTGGL